MKVFSKAVAGYSLSLLLSISVATLSAPVELINLYDAQGNHLLFVTFEYDNSGVNTARSVFAPDSTFLYRTMIKRNAGGASQSEASFNFNNDTLWKASYGSDGKNLSIQDQFGNDQVGGSVKFSDNGTNFDFFQGSSLINKMSYEKNADGSYSKINVYDNTGTMLYYAAIKYQGTGVVPKPAISLVKPSIKLIGGNNLIIRYNLVSAASIKCEVFTLSGKQVATLFSANEKAGQYQKSIRLSSPVNRFADGMYLTVLSVDNKCSYREKILVQNTAGGF